MSDPFNVPTTNKHDGIAHSAVGARACVRHRGRMTVVKREIDGAQVTSSFDGGFASNLHFRDMSDLFFDSALLPTGWAHDVRIGVDSGGWISAVDTDTTPRGARHVPGIAVPGVPNVHSHAFQRAMAGLTEHGSPMGDSFWSWRRRMYGFLRTLDPEGVEAIAAQLFVELLRRGFTSVAEFHYLRNDRDGAQFADPVEMARRVLRAGVDTGMGLTILPTLYTASDFGGAEPEHEQRRFACTVEELVGDIAVLGAGASAGTVRVGLALHSLRAVPPDALAVAVEAARGMDPSIPIHIHVAEQEREVERAVEWTGSRPVAWLLDHAPVDQHWCLIHATHLDEHEVKRVAASRAVVGLCPTTEANLGDGIFPLSAFQEQAGRWAVGTDSHVGRGPAGELRMLEYGQRLHTRTRNVAAGPHHRSSARTMLDAAWKGGASASGRRIGAFTPGARADVVVLDADHPALLGRSEDDALGSWIFSGDDTPVRDVFTGGHQVIRDGRHASEEQVRQRYAAVVRTLTEDTPQLAIDFE
jgi:formimidoylglutamate deiminase